MKTKGLILRKMTEEEYNSLFKDEKERIEQRKKDKINTNLQKPRSPHKQ